MALIDDGDLIRGLGFVALYAAYLEEAINECLDVFLANDATSDERLYRRQMSRKIDYIQKCLRGLEPLRDELVGLPAILQAISELLEERNLIIHGRIYAIPGFGDVRIAGRRGVPEIPATSVELYSLANDLNSACSPLLNASMFSLHRQFDTVRERSGSHA
jgi:hypothetical protein